MSDERCDLTDLINRECACPKHRGGEVVDATETVGQPFTAMYGGMCSTCERPIQVGQTIARLADEPAYVHAGRCPR